MTPERDTAMKSAILLVACVIVVTITAWNYTASIPFPWPSIDEHAHYSYTQHLIEQHRWWPDFANFFLYENGTVTAERNYLNHPPFFYWPMKLLGAESPTLYRGFCLAFCIAALLLYARIGYLRKLKPGATLIYALVPFALCVPWMTGFYSNDAWAYFGGALCCYGSYRWLDNINPSRAFALMILGLLFTAVKLTSLLLVGGYVGFVLLLALIQQRRFSASNWIAIVLVLIIASLPYLQFLLSYGSPAPNTPGQLALLHAQTEWISAPRMGFGTWLLFSLSNFADQFKGVIELTFLPLLLLLAAWASQLTKPIRRNVTAPAIMIRAATISTVLMLTIHLIFSHQRYVEFGWLNDNFIRYYFPLLPAYGLTIVELCLQLRTRIARRNP